MNACITIVLATSLLLLLPVSARSVLVRSADSETVADKSPAPALAHMAVVAGLSGVHVGKDWILTARHVLTAARNQKKTAVQLDGRAFTLRLDTEVPLRSGADRPDLALVRIDADPGLPALAISQASPTVGDTVLMVGNGPLQETRRRCFGPNGAEVPAPGPGVRCGYLWTKTQEGKTNGVQWGTNQVASVGAIFPGPQGARTGTFATTFRDGPSLPREAQAGVGDSGGPVFVQADGEWILAGVMLGVSAQSPAAALFGDKTYAADLSVVREAILRVVSPD